MFGFIGRVQRSVFSQLRVWYAGQIGHLPDSLSPENIRQGKAIRRNPTLTEHGSHILPYRGMGSGIPRALKAWSQIDLVDDPAGNKFSTVIWRPQPEWTGEVTGEVFSRYRDCADAVCTIELEPFRPADRVEG